MGYEEDPNDAGRGKRDSPISKPASSAGSAASASAQSDSQLSGAPENKRSDFPPVGGALRGVNRLSNLDDQIAVWAHQGPTPHPQIIKQHNDIQPGAGDRIMEDAHADIVLDRKVTAESFEYAIFESKVRLFTTVGVIFGALILIPAILVLFDPPESIVGTAAVGLAAASPLVRTLIGPKQSQKDQLESVERGGV